MQRSVLGIAALTLTVSGCAAYRPCPYHVAKAVGNCPAAAAGAGPIDARPDYTIGFVELDDWPNRRFFPIGQKLLAREQGDFRDSGQKHEFHTTLGNIPGQVTHCLTALGGQDCSSTAPAARLPLTVAGSSGAAAGHRKDPCSEHLGAGGVFGRVPNQTLLAPLPSVNAASPILLVRATGELIPGHDLFTRGNETAKFRDFLAHFVHDVIRQKLAQFLDKNKAPAAPVPAGGS
jgi:hypothetical protein